MEENITAEFVKKWIEKHHLTRNSYESVLSDALTNNGHYYIDNPYLRVWIKSNTVEFRELLPHELNENQQIVLDYLKNIYSDVYEDCSPLETMYLFGSRRARNEESELTEKEEFQVLAAFAEWGMKEVVEE